MYKNLCIYVRIKSQMISPVATLQKEFLYFLQTNQSGLTSTWCSTVAWFGFRVTACTVLASKLGCWGVTFSHAALKPISTSY